MGYQLWTSPTTGYRRQGTRLGDFNAVLGDRILASDICEPLRCCPAGAPATQMAAELQALDFDVAGVREQEGSPVIGLVTCSALTDRTVRDHMVEIEREDTVDAGMTVRDLLGVLKVRPVVFVEVNGDNNAILTRADLNKPMVRVYLFGLISLLEIHLGFWIAHAYQADTWQPRLKLQRMEAARKVQRERADQGQDLELLQCLQLCDKRTLIGESENLVALLGLGSKKACGRFLVAVERLRNSLAHSQYDLTVRGSWEEIIELTEHIQDAVSRSDRLVEEKAVERAETYIGALW